MNNSINYNDPAPLYEQVEKDLKRKIFSGELEEGDQVGSHSELTKEYGVSVITVKKALLNLVNQGFLYTRVGKGTYVANRNPSGKSKLVEQKTVGLVLRDLKHPFFSMIVHGIEERAYDLGFTLLLSSSSGRIDKEENQINHFKSLGVDGLIIASLSLEYRATPYIQKLHDENFPYIMISYMHDPDYWFVGSDHELGGYLGTEHLIKQGCKKIGYVNLGKGNLLGEVRKNGYSRALMEYDIPYNSNNIFYIEEEKYDSGLDRYQLGYQFGKQFVSLKDKPEALFFYNDTLALGFIKYALEAGISVPGDVAVVGYDDVEVSKFSSVPLTTVRQQVDKIGASAVEIISNRILKSDVRNRTIFKPELLVRESSVITVKEKSQHI